jgi:CheY-like chemotaxis protein
MQMSKNPILLVEDSPEDAEATLRSFKKSGVANPIYHCSDGDDALDYLHQRGRYAEIGSAPRPSVILLDLNMPGTDGREVLADIKQDEHLQKIPVVVLTTSSDERDIEKCYQIGANSYIRKPVDLEGFMRAIQLLKHYWFEIVVLPKEDESP